MAILEFLEKKMDKNQQLKPVKNWVSLCACSLFPNSITKRKLLINNFN